MNYKSCEKIGSNDFKYIFLGNRRAIKFLGKNRNCNEVVDRSTAALMIDPLSQNDVKIISASDGWLMLSIISVPWHYCYLIVMIMMTLHLIFFFLLLLHTFELSSYVNLAKYG